MVGFSIETHEYSIKYKWQGKVSHGCNYLMRYMHVAEELVGSVPDVCSLMATAMGCCLIAVRFEYFM